MHTAEGARAVLLAVLVGLLFALPIAVGANYPIGGMIIRVARHSRPVFMFPGGGRQLFPAYRLIALYGTPNVPELGALGEQDVAASIARVKALAGQYQPLMAEYAMPTLEIISTVASESPTDAGDYSYPIDMTTLRQWQLFALQNGVYVVLDLQPGRSDFLSQAKRLESMLDQPNVGLALDPEWRLGPQQLPLEQIGSVNIDEVNATANWLAALTRTRHLPQKLFLLHQFRPDMLPGRSRLDTTHPELAYAVQMDGQGSQTAKLDTWAAITADPPANIHFGWKNFYKKDTTLRSPQDTVSLDPKTWYISYQ